MQFDSRPLKVGNRLDFLACRSHATYFWKALNKGYNFGWNLTSIKHLHTKLWVSKVTRVPILGISGLPLGSLGTKWHLGVDPVARHRVYYKGKVVASPKFKPWWVLWIRVCPWLVHAPKVFWLYINQPVVSLEEKWVFSTYPVWLFLSKVTNFVACN